MVVLSIFFSQSYFIEIKFVLKWHELISRVFSELMLIHIQPFFSLSRRFVVRALIAQSIKSFNSSNNICQISKCHFVHIARQQASWLAATTQFQVKDLKIIQSFAIIVPDNGKFKSG